MRILGLDYGSRRIGVAICDEIGMTAQGVATLARKNRDADLDTIAELVKHLGVERIVVGYPLRLDGSEGIQCEKINRFIRRLEMRFSLPVLRWDEALSTKEAEELLRKRGVRWEKRREVVDRVAASIILQGYLDSIASGEKRTIPLKQMKIIKRILKIISGHRRETAILLLLAAILTGVAFFSYATSPVERFADTKIVDIPKGAGFFRITEIMNDAGLVANRPFFWLLALVKGSRKQIRAGEYEITGSMSPSEILDKLVRGEIKSYTVMLPEDITMYDVAKRLLADKLINEKEFVALAVDREFLRSLGIEAETIEGYLFPETYQFDRSMTTKEVIRVIVRQFWKEITPEMTNRLEKIGLTLHEWLTLASIIGKESGNKEEKPLISAVFHNRLRRGMKLQSDPTAVYHLEQAGTPVKTIRRIHLKLNAPHNTYLIDGLPPGPIANPGIDSLQAALDPAKVNYLYFVSKKDGSHQFSSSIDEHIQATSKYQINKQKK